MLPSFKILQVVAQAYSITPEELTGRKRTKNMAEARQLTAYFLRQINDLSYPAIGKILKKDHTTIIHACRKILEEIETRPRFRALVERVFFSFRTHTTSVDLKKLESLTTDEIEYLSKSINLSPRKETPYGFMTSEDILKTNRDIEITERESDILSKYRRGMTLDEIASTVNITRERVRQIVMNTLIKELGQKAKGGFNIDVQEYINFQKDQHMKSRYLSEDRKQELENKIKNGADISKLLTYYRIPKEKFFEYFPQYKEKMDQEAVERKRWSRFYLKCRNCGTTAIRHHSHGLCVECYPKSEYFKEVVRSSNERNREKRNSHYRKYLREYMKRPEIAARMKRAWDLKHYGGNREKAIERSGFRCAKCGISRDTAIKKFGKELFVRHIDKNKNNNNLSNLEVLCQYCFQKVPKT